MAEFEKSSVTQWDFLSYIAHAVSIWALEIRIYNKIQKIVKLQALT